MIDKIKIMFVCTGNGCRSRMAAGLARHIGGDRFEFYSAGLDCMEVDPRAAVVMAELGLDISGEKPQPIDPELMQRMDYVITLCEAAEEGCPEAPDSVARLYWPFPNPSEAEGTEAEIMAQFREVRDGIRHKLQEFLDGFPFGITGS